MEDYTNEANDSTIFSELNIMYRNAQTRVSDIFEVYFVAITLKLNLRKSKSVLKNTQQCAVGHNQFAFFLLN